jgi:hypothetical protein
MLKAEHKRPADSLDEVGSVKNMCERLSLMVERHTAGHPVPMESHVKMRRNNEICIKTSRATEEGKREGMKNVRVDLAPPPNLKAVNSKVPSNGYTHHKASESKAMKIRYQMPDCSKLHAKISTRRQ